MPDNQNQFWWQEAFLDDCQCNERKGRVNPMTERAAWIFELVRALTANFPNLLQSVPPLPPFTKLREIERQALELLVETLPYMRPPFRPGARSASPSKTKYSDPFPPMAFDLAADNAPLVAIFRDWLDWQRAKHGCKRPTGIKDVQTSHNRRRKDPNWRWVELLYHRPGEKPEPLTDRERTMRRDAKSFAQDHAKLVLRALAGADKQLTHELDPMRVFVKGVFLELEGQGLHLSEKLVGEIAEDLAQTLASNDSDALKTLISIVEATKIKKPPLASA